VFGGKKGKHGFLSQLSAETGYMKEKKKGGFYFGKSKKKMASLLVDEGRGNGVEGEKGRGNQTPLLA